MLEITIIVVFLGVTSLIYYIFENVINRNRQIKTRLERLKPTSSNYLQNSIELELEKPLLARIFSPLFVKLYGISGRITPLNARNQAEHLLDLAGHPGNLTINDFLAIKMVIMIGIPLVTYLVVLSSNMALLITGASFILGMILPNFVLKRQISSRQLQIIRSLPDNLDLITVSVEAGLGFDQALLKLVEKTNGPLTDEFKRVLHEIRIGKTRKDSLREMSIRTGVDDLQTFVAAIIQADQLGVSIGNVLRIQSQQLRQKRRLKAEERAQKAPVKMLIPMVLFIFPSLFIILLGPGVLQLIDNFTKLKK